MLCRAAFLLITSLPLTAGAVSAGGTFAGPANPGPSSMAWNPAALVALEEGEWAAMVDATVTLLHIEYDRAGMHPATGEPFPHTDFTILAPDLNFTITGPTPVKGLRLFVGGFVPSVLGSAWPDDGPQRYVVTDSTFATYGACVGATWQFGERFGIAAGAGPMFGYLALDNSIDLGAFANDMLGADLLPLEDPLLDATSELRGTGWSWLAVFGAWAQPLPNLRLGLGAALPRPVLLDGTIVIEADRLAEVLPGFDITPRGNIEVDYPVPWQVSFEAELDLGLWSVATMAQLINKSTLRVVLANVSEAEPNLIGGRQVSTKGVRDDWRVAVRVTREVGEAWRVGARLGFDPRYIPDETLTPANLDFTAFHLALGAEWQLADTWLAQLTYSWVLLVPMDIENSMFDPRASRASGLALPSPNGHYTGTAHQLVVGILWGAP